MASLALQFTALKCSPLSSSPLSQPSLFTQHRHNHRRSSTPIVNSVALSNAQNKERTKLKKLFEEAYERCRTAPMEGVSFTLEDFTAALEKYDFDSEVGSKVTAALLLLLFHSIFNWVIVKLRKIIFLINIGLRVSLRLKVLCSTRITMEQLLTSLQSPRRICHYRKRASAGLSTCKKRALWLG